MKTVFKYELPVGSGPRDVMLPRGCQTLHVGHQGDPNTVYIWALVHAGEPAAINKKFLVVGTGHEIEDPKNWQYIGTVNYHPIPLVWHVFQEIIR